MKRLFAVVLVSVLACGGDDDSGPSSPYESVAGDYVGVINETSQGYLLQADYSVTVTQTEGTLGGNFTLDGTLSDGVTPVSSFGAGAIGGTVATGSNPAVNLTAFSSICEDIEMTLSGTYDSATQDLTFPNTSIPIFDASCQVVLTFPNVTLVLSR